MRQRTAWTDALAVVPGHLAVDANNLFDFLNRTGSVPSEKRVALDLAAAREGLARDSDHLHWVPTRWQLADSFTKELRDGDAALTATLRRATFALDGDALEPYEVSPAVRA